MRLFLLIFVLFFGGGIPWTRVAYCNEVALNCTVDINGSKLKECNLYEFDAAVCVVRSHI